MSLSTVTERRCSIIPHQLQVRVCGKFIYFYRGLVTSCITNATIQACRESPGARAADSRSYNGKRRERMV